MKICNLILLMTSLMISSCTFTKRIVLLKKLNKTKLEKEISDTMKYRLVNDRIIAPIKINKLYMGEFIFDTGYTTTISDDFLKEKDFSFYTINFHNQANSTNLTASKRAIKNITYEINGAEYEKKKTTITSFGNSIKTCMGVDGIIGSDIFKYGILYLNPTTNNIGIYFNTINKYINNVEEYKKINIHLKPISSNPFLEMELFQKQFDALIDYGSRLELAILYNPSIHENIINSLIKNISNENIVKITSTTSLVSNSEGKGISNNTNNISYRLKLDSIKLGNQSLYGKFQLNIIPSNTKLIKGVIGMPFLLKYISYIDFPQKNFYLKEIQMKNNDINNTKPIVIFSKKYGTVIALDENKIWKDNNISLGDTVVMINNKKIPESIFDINECKQDSVLSNELLNLKSINIKRKSGNIIDIDI